MTHWLRALAALAALTWDLVLVPSTDKVAHNHSLLQFQGIQCFLQLQSHRKEHGTHKYMQKKKKPKDIQFLKIKKQLMKIQYKLSKMF